MHPVTEGGELRTVENAIRIGSDLKQCWFRGHTRRVGELLPAAHREPFVSARENIEFWAGQRFRLRARAYIDDVPAWDDYVSWLFLAQHHGVPTRLLDWSQNVLVGLYFAVTGGDDDKDGELWCMNFHELNLRSANWNDCFLDSPPIRYLAAAAFLEPRHLVQFEAALGLTTIRGPLALVPPLQFPRMSAQMSTFTIHPSLEPESRIESFLQGPTSLIRYIIPAACKADVARNLCRIGFTHENLYRSLDSLARTIKEEIIEPDFYMYPLPPRFDRDKAAGS
jgi:hypothetical protein